MQRLFDYFLNGQGRDTFDALKQDNTEAFLSLAEEINGIAKGSGQPVDKIWVANLINDLETFMDIPPIDIADNDAPFSGGLPGKGCTDVFAHTDDGYVKRKTFLQHFYIPQKGHCFPKEMLFVLITKMSFISVLKRTFIFTPQNCM